MVHSVGHADACSTILVNQHHCLLKHHCEATGKRSNHNQPLIWHLKKGKTIAIVNKMTGSYSPKWDFSQTRVGTSTLMSKE
jgi:hypothetical protein